MSHKTRRTHSSSVPVTISGLWALHPLVSIKDEASYDDASEICAGLSVRRLNAVQKEYFRELTALVENYEDRHSLLEKTESSLRKAAKTGAKRLRRIAKKPDMKAFAALALARLKAHYGERIVADSMPMLEDMRANKF